MFQLPPSIIKKIWEYDSTYKDVMNLCLLELQHVSPCWGLSVMCENNYHRDEVNEWNYKKFYNVSKRLAYYWNNEYKKSNTSRQQDVEDTDRPKHWTYNEFICDVFPKKHKRIFRNIKDYKYLQNNYKGDKYTFYKSEMSTKGKVFNYGNQQIEFKI